MLLPSQETGGSRSAEFCVSAFVKGKKILCHTVPIDGENTREYDILTIPETGECTVRLRMEAGTVQMDSIEFDLL